MVPVEVSERLKKYGNSVINLLDIGIVDLKKEICVGTTKRQRD